MEYRELPKQLKYKKEEDASHIHGRQHMCIVVGYVTGKGSERYLKEYNYSIRRKELSEAGTSVFFVARACLISVFDSSKPFNRGDYREHMYMRKMRFPDINMSNLGDIRDHITQEHRGAYYIETMVLMEGGK